MRTRAAALMMVCALVSALSSCGSHAEGSAATSGRTPITILWIGDTTGPLKVYGNLQLAGVKGAADYFNHQGGIAGHRQPPVGDGNISPGDWRRQDPADAWRRRRWPSCSVVCITPADA